MFRTLNVRPFLTATDDELEAAFRRLRTRDDVAVLLEVPPAFLRWVLYGKRERRLYVEQSLPKKHGGERRICIPPRNLRILQDKLLRILTVVYRPRPCVTGFVRRKSSLDNAHPHVGRRFVVTFDLHDFFPSLHLGRIRGTLQSAPYSVGPEAALTIAQIATHDDGHLPQGAPTSPILANMTCGPFDTAMMQFAKKHRFRYTRYADDITLSTTQRLLPESVMHVDADGTAHLGTELVELVSQHKFEIRAGKTRVRHSLRRQLVTGLVVNEFPNIPRSFVRDLRALIHSAAMRGVESACAAYCAKAKRKPNGDASSWLLNVIRGKLAYVKMVRGDSDPVYRRLLRDANEIPGAPQREPTPLETQRGQPVRRRSRKAVNWALWAERYRHSVFRLRCRDREQDRFGTAFRVGPSCFVTAGHNVEYRAPSTSNAVRREAVLESPLEEEAALGRVRAAAGELGDVDIAIGHASLPATWAPTIIPTQERLPQVGEEVAAIGFPDIAFREVELVLHVGRIESVTTGYRRARFLTVSFASGPALSGAPLIDANGHCIGVMIENTFLGGDGAPARPYGQAVAIGHWRAVGGAGPRLTSALDAEG